MQVKNIIVSNKSLYLLTLMMLLCFNTLFGQKLKLGVTISPTMSFVSSDNEDVSADGSGIGLLYGLMADYQFSDNERYALFTGFNVHHTSGKFKSATNTYSVAASIIEIPAIFKLSSDFVNSKNFYGQFGLNFGLPISDKVKEGPDDLAEVTGILLAVNIGAGMHFDLSQNGARINAGIFFDNGFTNVYKVEGEKFRLKHLGFRAGVYF